MNEDLEGLTALEVTHFIFPCVKNLLFNHEQFAKF